MGGTVGAAPRRREGGWRKQRVRVVRGGSALALLAAVLVVSPAQGANDGRKAVAPTLADEDVFVWPAQFVESAVLGDPDHCNDTDRKCFDYFFDVAAGTQGDLRVAIDVKMKDGHVRDWADPAIQGSAHSPGSAFRIDVYPPDGGPPITSARKRPYTQELWVPHPVAEGRWRARVTPVDVERRTFRLRAGVDVVEPHGEDGMPLDPNLRAVAPFELTLHVPTTNYGPGVRHQQPTGACMVEETVEGFTDLDDEQVRIACLRFSFGMENAGPGPLVVRSVCDRDWAEPSCTDADPAWDAEQIRYCTDAQAATPPYRKVCGDAHPAGTLRLDPTHLHHHYEEAWAAELFRVTTTGWQPGDRKPDLASVGSAPKLGFDPAPEMMPRFDRMFQDNLAWPLSGSGFIRLDAGWADIYEWNRSGNGIPVPEGMAPGWYLMRAVVDPDGHIIETHERDNASYALFEVLADGDGLRIAVHERGIGESPWDPPRRVLTSIP